MTNRGSSFGVASVLGCLLMLQPLAGAADLPLRRVVLFTSGVGFFQREGELTNDTLVELSFRADQINDLLKSLVLQDFGGGKVAPVVFGSPEPVQHTLNSFPIDLADNPSLTELLNRMRGARVEVASPKEMQGVIVGVETQRQTTKDMVIETHVLNLLSDQGLRAVPLEQVQQIKVLDEPLLDQLRGALKVLANSHDAQRKPVILNFSGKGIRRVSAGYVLEAPIWRTSYRLELQNGKPPFLQGWAIVENPTDDDWKSVELTLVSGRPISFIMDLYQPLYVTRPTVVPEIYSSLRPQVYESGVEAEKEVAAEPAGRARRAARMEEAPRFGMAATPALAASAPEAGKETELGLANRGVSAEVAAGSVGELFEYAVDQPVSVARHKSALLPIVNAPIEAEKLSIYNETIQRRFPLNGLRLKNTTGLHLMQGPITVFDGGTYAGDAQIEDLQPKEERLISYALDLNVEVEPLQRGGTNEITAIQIRKGVLTASRRLTQSKIYSVRNKAANKRVVLIEHPFRPDWKLVEPPKPFERTPTVYRFQVAAEPGKTEKLEVTEEHVLGESAGLVDADVNLLLLYTRNAAIKSKVKDALGKVVGMRDAIGDLQRRIRQIQQQTGEIAQEQGRIRDNMKVLAQNSELYGRYVKELDKQETQLEGLRGELTGLRAEEETKRKQLEDYVTGLDVG